MSKEILLHIKSVCPSTGQKARLKGWWINIRITSPDTVLGWVTVVIPQAKPHPPRSQLDIGTYGKMKPSQREFPQLRRIHKQTVLPAQYDVLLVGYSEHSRWHITNVI